MEEYKSFGEYLKSLRIQKGLTAEEVGEKIEIKIDKIKAFERNIEIPELDEMYKLSEFYNVLLFRPSCRRPCAGCPPRERGV